MKFQRCVISTLRWAVLTVLWIGFCLTGAHFTVRRFFFVFMYVSFVLFYQLHNCHTVGWTWWDWSLSYGPLLPLVIWHSFIVILLSLANVMALNLQLSEYLNVLLICIALCSVVVWKTKKRWRYHMQISCNQGSKYSFQVGPQNCSAPRAPDSFPGSAVHFNSDLSNYQW